jgi:exonuclease SbcD
VRRAQPALDVIAIAGNHDSPARLGAAGAVLHELGIHVIGGLPRDATGAIDLDRVLIPVAGGRGLVAAVPFIRPIDLPPDRGDASDPLATIYAEVVAGARARKAADQALIVTGHLYVAGADVSFLSERRVSIGGQESASTRLFPDDIDYVALGHIHRAQRVGRPTMRYAGAPIALSLEEGHYKHSVVVVELADGKAAEIRQLMIPRTIEIIRLGPAPLLAIVAELAALAPLAPRGEGLDPARPYLEVIVALDRPEPRLRQLIETALEGKRPRLVRLGVEHTGDGAALADHGAGRRLAELDPRDVFVRCWAKNHAEAPTDAVLVAFERLLSEVRGDAELLA